MDNFRIMEQVINDVESKSKVTCVGSKLPFLSREKFDCRQIAFSQEHILASVLSFMEVKSLEDCRHVCRIWKDAGAAAISKRIKIILNFDFYVDPQTPHASKHTVLFTSTKNVLSNEKIEETSYRYEPNLQDRLLTRMNSSSYFPCKNCYVKIWKFTNATIQNYLTQIGPHLTTLELRLMVDEHDTQEAEMTKFMKCLAKLLSDNAVYLENFGFGLFTLWWLEMNQYFNAALTNWDLNPQAAFLPKNSFLHRLKSFVIADVFSTIAFRDIMDNAIRLRSLALVKQACFFGNKIVNYLEYFMENQNLHKVSVISHLCFHITNESVPAFEKFLNHRIVFERLKLKYFGLKDVNCTPTLPDFHHRVGRLIELFLLSSWNTLRDFTVVQLHRFGIFKIPKLSMLSSIGFHFGSFAFTSQMELTELNTRIFPIGFCAKQSFPVLRTIVVNFYFCHQDPDALISRICDSFDGPVCSVKKLEIRHGRLSESARLLVCTLFPNAIISVCFKHSELILLCNKEFV